MLFRFVLLAALVFHAAFCVAQNSEKVTALELMFSDKTREWATLRISKGNKKRLVQVGKNPSQGYEYASCASLQASQSQYHKLGQCRVNVGCDKGEHEMTCTVTIYKGNSKLKGCDAFTEDALQSLPECDTDLRPKPVAVAVRNPQHNPDTFKQLMLYLPPHPNDPLPYVISKELWNNARLTDIDCDKLPTGKLKGGVDRDGGRRCALVVRCWFIEGEELLSVTCQAEKFRDDTPYSLLGECWEAIPEGMEGCNV